MHIYDFLGAFQKSPTFWGPDPVLNHDKKFKTEKVITEKRTKKQVKCTKTHLRGREFLHFGDPNWGPVLAISL